MDKFKQKGIEYFDHLKWMLENNKVELDSENIKHVAEAIRKETYKGYADKLGYKDAEYVLDELKKHCEKTK